MNFLLLLLLPLLAFCAATPSECGPNEIFKSCGSACEPSCSNPNASNQPCPQCGTHCEPTCAQPDPPCIKLCKPNVCQCSKRFVRHENVCIQEANCPK
ncbi:hypothetical protein L5515_003320 [Caenorhabditis briggsae]|uniref:TIL domain-containing protein n=1 Tax=Caenorhabditis briggsae TaxID=6238 RepID=A0AAE9JBC8_CAEBR|nr:hypothetical protein L5515_003320 [Caenorhabditis briggsae]